MRVAILGSGRKGLSEKNIQQFERYLREQKKATATIAKYVRDVTRFRNWLGNERITRQKVLKYKACMAERFKLTSVNSTLASLNKYFEFSGLAELKVKNFRVQRSPFTSEEKELTRNEYKRLIAAAEDNERLRLVIETLCSTGIRVSELPYITVEAIFAGKAEVYCKGKVRVVMIPKPLTKKLKKYIVSKGLTTGMIFITKNGKALDRSNIWSDMKGLCAKAKVSSKKVFPHNLRHLFARVFYSIKKDIARLADILGHGSIETTRIYICPAEASTSNNSKKCS